MPLYLLFRIFFVFFSAVREFKSPCLLFIFILFCCTAVRTSTVRSSTTVVLMYTHGGFVGVVGEFFCCVLCFTAGPGTTYCCTAVVQDGWVVGWIGSWVCPWVGIVFFPPAIPAPRWHSSAYR